MTTSYQKLEVEYHNEKLVVKTQRILTDASAAYVVWPPTDELKKKYKDCPLMGIIFANNEKNFNKVVPLSPSNIEIERDTYFEIGLIKAITEMEIILSNTGEG